MSETQSTTVVDAVKACAEDMDAPLTDLVQAHGCFFWIALTAVLGEDLWRLLNQQGCPSTDVDWVLDRLRPDLSTGNTGALQPAQSLVADLMKAAELPKRHYWARIRAAENDIRALEANLEPKHGALVMGVGLADFLRPALARLVGEGDPDIAQDMWSNVKETALAPELRETSRQLSVV